ncbi:MAG: hypothetical protein QOD77_202 [Thermoplasmata archaeon]|jgi:hypothetical protein|nr:hypothetical protein [Thermoplasmata archaeon]
MQPLTPALLLALALAASGCASSDDATDTATGTTPTTGTDGAPPTDAPAEPGASAAATEHTCTSEPGYVIGAQGPTVAGCDLVTLDGDSIVVAIDVPAGCSVLYDEDGDGMSEGTAAEGETYGNGTTLFMGCDAVNATADGTVAVAKAG